MVLLYILLGIICVAFLVGGLAFLTGGLQEMFGEDTGVFYIKYKNFRYYVYREVNLFGYIDKVLLDDYGHREKEDANRAIRNYKLSRVTEEWRIDDTKGK